MSEVGVLVKLLHFVVEVIVGSSPGEVGGGRVRLGLGWLPAAYNRPVLHTKSSLVGVMWSLSGVLDASGKWPDTRSHDRFQIRKFRYFSTISYLGNFGS